MRSRYIHCLTRLNIKEEECRKVWPVFTELKWQRKCNEIQSSRGRQFKEHHRHHRIILKNCSTLSRDGWRLKPVWDINKIRNVKSVKTRPNPGRGENSCPALPLSPLIMFSLGAWEYIYDNLYYFMFDSIPQHCTSILSRFQTLPSSFYSKTIHTLQSTVDKAWIYPFDH